jgi:threonine/homoserine/homoserine lactone efflux protein
VAAVVIVTPGPDTALTIRNSLRGGVSGGVHTALGVASGQAVWTVAAAAGVAALLVASEPAFLAVKLAGAAYLVALGLQALRDAVRGAAARPGDDRPCSRGVLRAAAAYRQGLLSNLGNPKMAVFFTSLLPQFAPAEEPFVGLVGLGLTFSAMTALWLSGYALAISKLGDLLRRPRPRRVMDAITGVALVGLGARVASESR